MSIFRSEQIQQPISLTGSLFGTASYATYAANATTFPYTGSATISGSLIVNGVTQLTQILSQTDANDPTATTLTNTTGKTFSWQRYNNNAGWYRITANDLIFYTNKTFVTLTPGFLDGTVNSGNDYIVWYEILDEVTIDIFVKQVGGSRVDGILHQAGFDVKCWPDIPAVPPSPPPNPGGNIPNFP